MSTDEILDYQDGQNDCCSLDRPDHQSKQGCPDRTDAGKAALA